MWYSDGKVNVTKNSPTIIGVDTLFSLVAREGDLFLGPDGLGYEVVAVFSETGITVDPPYRSNSKNGERYGIVGTRSYNKALHDKVADMVDKVLGLDSLPAWAKSGTPTASTFSDSSAGAHRIPRASGNTLSSGWLRSDLSLLSSGKVRIAEIPENIFKKTIVKYVDFSDNAKSALMYEFVGENLEV